MKLKDIPKDILPREKALNFGVNSLNDQELLALIIQSGVKGCNVLELANQIICKAGGLGNLPTLNLSDIICIKGIKEAKALKLLAIFELSKRIAFSNISKSYEANSPELLYSWLKEEFKQDKQERLLVVFLNVKNKIIGHKTIFVGCLDRSLIHPREIFKEAISKSSSKIIIIHNHPSGDSTPSNEDIKMTKQLIKASQIMGIGLLDHIVVGKNNFTSLRALGVFN